MSVTQPPSTNLALANARSPMAMWLVALVGFASMYVPVYWWAANTIWQSDDHAHGVIILVVALWLFWTLRKDIVAAAEQPRPALGWPVFLVGLAVYALGRMFSISIFEFGSQPLVLAGLFLLLKGYPAARIAWFPILYLVFMIPLPGIFVDAVTGPLKNWISSLVTDGLHWVGYPISRSGVTISIGQYQMLVADACSGLHSMFSLSALGTLFMYIMARRSKVHNAVMLISILPIAFAANIVRVMTLVLITYHLGDEAGQGFLHGAAGMVLMVTALLAFFALDNILSSIFK
jgi:exosortase B